MTNQKHPPDFKIASMRRIQRVAMLFEGSARSIERLRRPTEIARSERNLCLSDDASCARNGFFRAELNSDGQGASVGKAQRDDRSSRWDSYTRSAERSSGNRAVYCVTSEDTLRRSSITK